MSFAIAGTRRALRQGLLLILLAVLLLRLPGVSAGSALVLNETERAWLDAHPLIRVGPDPDFRPIEYFSAAGRHEGLAADYLAVVGQKLGIRFEVVQLPNWGEVVTQAKERRLDMWSAASPTPQRLKYMRFTRSLVEVPAVILVRNRVLRDLEMADLVGMRVAVVEGYAAHDFLMDRYPHLTLDPVPDLQTALRKVSFGMADAMVGNLATATEYMEQQGITNLRVAGDSGYYYRWAFAVRSDWPELVALLDRGLASIDQAERDRIFSRWIHIAQAGWRPDLQFFLWLFLLLFSLAIAGTVLWNRTLKRLVVERTAQLNHELEERRRTASKLKLRDRAIAAASNGLVIIDHQQADWPIIYANPAFESITGLAIESPSMPNHLLQQPNGSRHWAGNRLIEAMRDERECQLQWQQVRPDGTVYWCDVHLSPVQDEQGKVAHFIASVADITERKQHEAIVHHIAEGLSAATGSEFFEQLVSHLAQALGIAYVFVGRLADPQGRQVNTLAVWARGELAENFVYDLAFTPCENVVHAGACSFDSGIQQSYPKDQMLCDMGAESYVGLPLRAADGRVLGLLAALDNQALSNPEFVLSLLTIFAARATAELERQEADQALRSSEAHYRVLFETAHDGLVTYDQNAFIDCNRRMTEIFGCPREEIIGFGPEKFSPPVQPDGSPSSSSAFKRIRAALDGQPQVFEWLHRRLDGIPVYTEVSLNRVYTDGKPVLSARIHDITERRQREEQQRLAASVFDGTTEGIVITDAHGVILKVNRAFSEITGYQESEVLGKTPRVLRSDYHDSAFYQVFWDRLQADGLWQGEIWNRRKSGEAHPVWQNISAIRNERGEIVQYISIFSDITDKKLSEQRIEHLAHYDVLTDLPNRVLFTERCEHALSRARRDGHQLVVLFLDLDRFKHINDSLGHPVGDRLLQQVARRLLDAVREEDTVARLGGDEFVVVLEEVQDGLVVAPIAEKLLQAFHTPFELAEHSLHVSPSIGIAIYPTDGDSVTTLVRNADVAMYRAKESGRNNYQFYTREMTLSAHERLTREISLRQAVEQEQLLLHYQPQYCLETGALRGLEALVRWQHPEQGVVAPDRFIPLAEETGLILDIGQWVLHAACRQAFAWSQAGHRFGRVAVNVSGQQIERGAIVATVRSALAESGLPAEFLELEITESFIVGHAKQAISTLGELRDLGVTLAIDDFGTGYSSLSYLKRLPIHKLKIDRSFVDDVPGGRFDVAISRAVIALGSGLGLKVIAEGVENESQQAFLQQEGCHLAQGYLYARPLPPDVLEGLLMNPPDQVRGYGR